MRAIERGVAVVRSVGEENEGAMEVLYAALAVAIARRIKNCVLATFPMR